MAGMRVALVWLTLAGLACARPVFQQESLHADPVSTGMLEISAENALVRGCPVLPGGH